MPVYVDDARNPFGRYLMCHMWADTREELFAMVDAIGVQRKWFQRPPSVDLPGMKASWEHFDIVQSKRALAVAAGAIETDKYGPTEHVARQRGQQELLDRIAALRARRRLHEVRADGGCLYCDADQGESHRSGCAHPALVRGAQL